MDLQEIAKIAVSAHLEEFGRAPNFRDDWWFSSWIYDGRPSSFEEYISACSDAWQAIR